MKHLIRVWICMVLGLAVPAVFCLPGAEEVNKIALEYVRSSANYVDNGGFGEIVTATRLGDTICIVAVKYRTRHVGMLQVIGQFVSYVTIDSSTLQVIEATTEDITGQIEEPDPGVNEPGNASDPDEPILISPSEEESYRYKISYTINETREMIRKQGLEANLSEVLVLLDRAQILLDDGNYDEALNVALEARAMAEKLISPAEPGEEPERPGEEEMPWLYGYVVVFDHEPTPEEWAKLKEMFNATLIAEASVYVNEDYSYWVKVSGISPYDLEKAEGVKEVWAFRGDLISPAEGEDQVPEPFLWLSILAGGMLTVRGTRRS